MSRDVHLRVPDDVYAEIAAYARADGRPIANLMLHAIKAHMARRPRSRFAAADGQETTQGTDPALPVQARGSQGTEDGGPG